MRKTTLVAAAATLALSFGLGACGQQAVSSSEPGQDQAASAASQSTQSATNTASAVPNTLAQDEDALVSTYASKFTQETYADQGTGLSVTYNMYLPEGYDASKSYPMVVFIADSSCTGDDPTRSLTQGLGAVVWASAEWQAAHPTIVCVPTYPETILDDHGSYTTTEYVELTKRLIDSVSTNYAVDTNRIYGTGQSMGCMTTLILASEYPDLYAGCMFVDGQWDVSALKGLETQRFVYFAAEDDTSAYSGLTEVKNMFDADSVAYASAQWDGNWTPDQLSSAANELFSQGKDANFVTWKTGTIDAGNAGGGGPAGGPAGGPSDAGNAGGPSGNGPMGQGGPSGDSASGEASGQNAGGPNGGPAGGGMGGASYHMASFDYTYNCVAAMEWLFQK